MLGLDLEVFKEIPGYKAILKAVLKSQIQALVEQLARQTGEESVLLTACVEEGTLSHLGSDFGMGFLEGHDDFKSQFLGFCLKRYQLKRQTHTLPAAQTRRRGPTGPNKRPRLSTPKTAHFPSPHPLSITQSPSPKRAATSKQHQNLSQTTSFAPDTYTGYEDSAVDMTRNLQSPNYLNSSINEPEAKNVHIKMEPLTEDNGQFERHKDKGMTIEDNQMLCKSESYPNVMEQGANFGQSDGVGMEEGNQEYGNVTGNQSDIEAVQGNIKLETDKPVCKSEILEEADAGNNSSDLEKDGVCMGNGSGNESSTTEKKKNRRKGDVTPVRKCKQNPEDIENYLNLESMDRPYPCTNCPKRFKERHHLTYHLRTHSGLRPYTCDICNKAFTQTSSLNTHRKIHMNEINCGMCGRMFKKHSDFSLHVCYNSEQLTADEIDSAMYEEQ